MGTTSPSSAARGDPQQPGVPRGRDVDRLYLDGVIARSQALLRLLVDGMNSTRTTELQYFIQQHAPVILGELDRAQALRKSL